MIIGIGTDLVEVVRMERMLHRHGARACERIFTAAEAGYCDSRQLPAESFAARFAAKEALFKALGTGWTGGVGWREVEVLINPVGAPRLVLHGRTEEIAGELGVVRCHLALAHTSGMATAYVVLEGAPNLVPTGHVGS